MAIVVRLDVGVKLLQKNTQHLVAIVADRFLPEFCKYVGIKVMAGEGRVAPARLLRCSTLGGLKNLESVLLVYYTKELALSYTKTSYRTALAALQHTEASSYLLCKAAEKSLKKELTAQRTICDSTHVPGSPDARSLTN